MRTFTSEALHQAAERQDPLLLVVIGEVYDVTSGRTYYGRQDGESYAGFASGIDASRAFLTADFELNATDDLNDLTAGQCLGIEHWVHFYRDHSTYTRLGVAVGRFFDASGEPTAEHAAFRACVARGTHQTRENRRALRARAKG